MTSRNVLRSVPESAAAEAAGVDAGTLSMEANHRIANHLAAIVGLMRLHAASVTSVRQTMTTEEVRLLLLEIAGRIDTVGQLHKLLAQGPQRTVIDLGEFLREVCAIAIASLSPSQETSLSYDCSPGCTVRSEQVVPLALIINEAVTNAVKYAHPSGVPGKIILRCQQVEPGGLLVEITDDGVGLPEGFDPATNGGLGLRVVRSLSEQLGARLDFESTSLGLRVRLLMAAQCGRGELRPVSPVSVPAA